MTPCQFSFDNLSLRVLVELTRVFCFDDVGMFNNTNTTTILRLINFDELLSKSIVLMIFFAVRRSYIHNIVNIIKQPLNNETRYHYHS